MKVVIRGPFLPYTSYGILSQFFAESLINLGYDVKCHVMGVDEQFGMTIPNAVKERFCFCAPGLDHEVVFHIPGFASEPFPGKRIIFTMWETTKVPSHWIDGLNRCYAIIVPNEWNKKVFHDSGVSRPIHVVPLWSNGMKPSGKFPESTVFGYAGRQSHGGIRKSFSETIKAFQLAFPNEHDVFLRIKLWPDCNVPPIFDSRIQVIKGSVDLLEWYQSLSAFVSVSKGEGWNLHLHEAMACGKPGIACDFSGHTTFFKPDYNGYGVKYELVAPLAQEYHAQGLWANPDVDDLVKQMREVYEQPTEAFYRGMNAIKSVKKYTPQNSVDAFVEVLRKTEII